MNDPVLVINENDQIADRNPAAWNLVGVDADERVEGSELSKVLEDGGHALLGYVQFAESTLDSAPRKRTTARAAKRGESSSCCGTFRS